MLDFKTTKKIIRSAEITTRESYTSFRKAHLLEEFIPEDPSIYREFTNWRLFVGHNGIDSKSYRDEVLQKINRAGGIDYFKKFFGKRNYG